MLLLLKLLDAKAGSSLREYVYIVPCFTTKKSTEQQEWC